MYDRFYRDEKLISAPLALGLIVFLGLTIIFFVGSKEKRTGENLKDVLSARIEITNKAANSATVIVCLAQKKSLHLIYGSNSDEMDQSVYDDRDLSTNPESKYCHYFNLRDLKDDEYYMKPISEDKSDNFAISKFSIKQLMQSQKLTPLWGKLMKKNGDKPQTGIILARFFKTEKLSTLVKNGDWLLPLHYLSKIPKNEDSFELEIIDDEGKSTFVSAIYGNVEEIQKTIVLGNDYNFTQAKSVVLGEETSETIEKLNDVDVIFPKPNASIPSFRPLFKGAAPSGTLVALELTKFEVDIKPLKKFFNTTTSSDGIWSFTPQYDLVAGKYELTIKAKDEFNKEKTIKRRFSIAKSGESVLGDATSSAELTPTIFEELTATPLPLEEPTVEITPRSDLPGSGITILPLTLISFGVVILGAMMILIF